MSQTSVFKDKLHFMKKREHIYLHSSISENALVIHLVYLFSETDMFSFLFFFFISGVDFLEIKSSFKGKLHLTMNHISLAVCKSQNIDVRDELYGIIEL